MSWSTPAVRRADPSPLDELFVAGAVHHEPSATDRAAAARQARSRWRRVRAMEVRGLVAVVAVVAALALGGASGVLAGVSTSLDLPHRLQLVVAVPEGVEATATLVTAVQHEAVLAAEWLEQQTGRTFNGNLATAEVARLGLVDEALAGSPEAIADRIEREVRSTGHGREVLPVVVTTLGMADHPDTCGLGSPMAVVVFLGNCGSTPAVTTPAFGRGVSRTIAHELVHALGGVPDCAPHHHEGHVTDDPGDLMAAVSSPTDGPPVLDRAGDDYFGRGGEVCQDIRDSVLWR